MLVAICAIVNDSEISEQNVTSSSIAGGCEKNMVGPELDSLIAAFVMRQKGVIVVLDNGGYPCGQRTVVDCSHGVNAGSERSEG